MRRNMKFLLLLAIFASSIMAAYFVSGCGDDSTVIEAPPVVTNDTTTVVEQVDRVLGSVQGVVHSAYDNSVVSGVTVKYVKNDDEFTTTTDADGYYLFDDSLSSGWYRLTFSMTGYATRVYTAYIPTISEIKADLDNNNPVGDYEFMDTEDAWLFPTSVEGAPVTVTGVVYTALPAPGKDQVDPMSLDDPDLVSRAAGVTVLLQYDVGGDQISPNTYTAETDGSGIYTFSGVPYVPSDWWYDSGSKADESGDKAANGSGSVTLITLPWQKEGTDSSFEGTSWNVEMVPPPEQTVMPNIFAPLVGSGSGPVATDKPVVLTYTFEGPGFPVGDNPVLTFSQSMDPATAEVALDIWDGGWDAVDFAFAWSSENKVLTLDPALSLIPDEQYRVSFSGKGSNGLEIYGGPWQRNLWTEQGMRFVATNLDNYGDDDNPFTQFPLGNNITITFDMNVDLTNPNGWVRLIDTWNNREVSATVTASGATVTITPDNDLKSYATYELDFRIYSNLRGDYVDDSEVKSPKLTFTTENTADIPTAPTGFALDMGTGWKADWDDTLIDFKWNSVPGAEYYQIFAKDNHNNTDLIIVADTIWDVSYHTMQVGWANLADPENVSFDLYFDDGIQTPFSGGNQITFQIRAVNTKGAGPFSSAITVADQTPPSFDSWVEGCADNTADDENPMEFGIGVEGFYSGDKMEYVSTITFSFVEMGGDPAYKLSSSDIAWDWDVDMRLGEGMGTVPAGKCGSADWMILTITDNSGNAKADTIDLNPYIVISEPNASTTDFEAPWTTLEWYIYDSDCGDFNYGDIDLFFSWDGGTTWSDTFLAEFEADGWGSYSESWAVVDTFFSDQAVMGLRDADGGWIWQSDVFTYNGIMLTGPDSAWLDTNIVYDDHGTDSTGVELTFDFAGLDSVGIWYMEVATKAGWILYDSIAVSGGTGSYTFYPPDKGYDWECAVKVADFDADARPMHELAWSFGVTNDYVEITNPGASDMVPGGDTLEITWDYVGSAGSMVGIAWSYDDGATWDTLTQSVAATDSSFKFLVPNNIYSNDSAWIQIIDINDLNVLDEVGPFSVSGIVFDAPMADDEWLVGTGQNIDWHSVGDVGNITIYWSRDGFVTDSSEVVTNLAVIPPVPPYPWSVPASEACSTVTFRAYGNNDAVYTESGEMTFSGVVVTSPVSGNLAQGASTTITWDNVGTLVGGFVDVQYKYITSGPPVDTSDWIMLAPNTANDGSWQWDPIPAPPAEKAWVMVKKAGAPTGSDQGGQFSISGVVVVAPNGGETWVAGNNYDITWNVINPTAVGNISIALYKDPGSVFIQDLVTGLTGSLETWTWAIPAGFTPGTAYYIKITADAVPTISDVSDDWFEIQ